MKKRLVELSETGRDQLVAHIVEFFIDNTGTGKQFSDLEIPDMNANDLHSIVRSLVRSRIILTNHPGRDARYITPKDMHHLPDLLRDRE